LAETDRAYSIGAHGPPECIVIIALVNQKGGVGKTTLATHLAGEFAFAGRTVVVIDADPQGSALDWAQIRAQSALPRCFGVMGLARETIHQEVPELAKTVDDIVIDGPPRVTALARSAILAAEVVLIPVQPSPYDVWASAEVVSMVTEALIFKPTLRAAFVVNRAVVRTVIGREVRGAVVRHGLSVLQRGVSQRVVFAESAATGRLVREIDPRSAATREIEALASELLERFR
jgi:chromosome partitioning protein